MSVQLIDSICIYMHLLASSVLESVHFEYMLQKKENLMSLGHFEEEDSLTGIYTSFPNVIWQC